jgi:DNA-binding NtrC family response regulator
LWITDAEEEILDRVRFSPTVVQSAIEGLQRLENEDFDVVLASLPEREESAVAILLEQLQQTQPTTPILIYAPGARATEVVRLLRLAAFHVFEHGDASSLLYLPSCSGTSREP